MGLISKFTASINKFLSFISHYKGKPKEGATLLGEEDANKFRDDKKAKKQELEWQRQIDTKMRLVKESGLSYAEWWEINKYNQVKDVVSPGWRERRDHNKYIASIVAATASTVLLLLLLLILLQRLNFL